MGEAKGVDSQRCGQPQKARPRFSSVKGNRISRPPQRPSEPFASDRPAVSIPCWPALGNQWRDQTPPGQAGEPPTAPGEGKKSTTTKEHIQKSTRHDGHDGSRRLTPLTQAPSRPTSTRSDECHRNGTARPTTGPVTAHRDQHDEKKQSQHNRWPALAWSGMRIPLRRPPQGRKGISPRPHRRGEPRQRYVRLEGI